LLNAREGFGHEPAVALARLRLGAEQAGPLVAREDLVENGA
jgi:hypothetical protein